MSKNKLQWRRTRSDGGLDLYVYEDEKWKHYSQSKLHCPDRIINGTFGKTSDGYATMQACVKAGYEYVPVSNEDRGI